jgi:hypothetical protein
MDALLLGQIPSWGTSRPSASRSEQMPTSSQYSGTAQGSGVLEFDDHAKELLEEVSVAQRSPDVEELQRRVEKLQRRRPDELLEVLAGDFGMSWTAISKLVGVSIPAVRKWRGHGSISPAHAADIAQLAGLCEFLESTGVADPARWLDTRVWPDVPIRRADLVASNRLDLISAYASGRIASGSELLDQFDPGWRREYPAERSGVLSDAPSPTVFVASD